MTPIEKLLQMRSKTKGTITRGLEDQIVKDFLSYDGNLEQAILEAYTKQETYLSKYPFLAQKEESDLIETLQEDYINFYAKDTINPYIALCAKGPWIVTLCGSVIHDSGGYGMLGFGHNPDFLSESEESLPVMANIMTANILQYEFSKLLNKEIGHTRDTQHRDKFKYLCLNSGSEAMSLALRISDKHALDRQKEDPTIKEIKTLVLAGSFHGRTDRPALISHSSLPTYKKHLHSFNKNDNLVSLKMNDLQGLEAAFNEAKSKGVFFEALVLEPVQGEGNPGLGVSPEFYALAASLCKKHKTLLIVDSIQAGIRAQGTLSICDYDGFSKLSAPDMEIFSKALNGGAYPLSVVALNSKIASIYVQGLYGNTMTTNPKALWVGCAILKNLTLHLRENIKQKGLEFLDGLKKLQEEFPKYIISIQGTGLLFSCEMDQSTCSVIGFSGLETRLRKKGIGVIHGGKNALRFTPIFHITSKEIQLILDKLRETLKEI